MQSRDLCACLKEKANKYQELSEGQPGEYVPAVPEAHHAAYQPHCPAAQLEKDMVLVWFCSHHQKGKQSSSNYSQEDFEASRPPFSGYQCPPVAPGPHFGTPGYARPHFTTLYSTVPFPKGEAFPTACHHSRLSHAFKLSCQPFEDRRDLGKEP